MDETEWAAEMVGMRKSIAQFANIPACEVSGENFSLFLSGRIEGISLLETTYFRNAFAIPAGRW